MSVVRICALLRELREGGAGTLRELAATVEAPPESIYHVLRVMEAEGLVEVTGLQGAAKVYELAPPGTPKCAPYVRKDKRNKIKEPS